MISPFAEIPSEWNGVTFAVIGTIIGVLLLGGLILWGLQKTRETLVKELQVQLAAQAAEAAEAQKVQVQSPLTVQAHVEFTPVDDHRELVEIVQKLSDSVNERFKDVALASSASREKIYNLLREQGEKLQLNMKQDLNGVHDSIAAMLTAIGELRGEIKHLSKK